MMLRVLQAKRAVAKSDTRPDLPSGIALKNYRYNPQNYLTSLETKMAKLTLQEQLLQAGLVTSKKNGQKSNARLKNHVFRLVRPERRWKKIKKAQLERDKQLSEQQKQAVLAKEFKAQVKQLIEMNRINISKGDIGFNFTDNNVIKKIDVDKLTQTQLINGRLAIARLVIDNSGECEICDYSRERRR
nr:nucleoprotein/polynucleotide-associated enzyme [Salmonella sp. NCTC 7297]